MRHPRRLRTMQQIIVVGKQLLKSSGTPVQSMATRYLSPLPHALLSLLCIAARKPSKQTVLTLLKLHGRSLKAAVCRQRFCSLSWSSWTGVMQYMHPWFAGIGMKWQLKGESGSAGHATRPLKNCSHVQAPCDHVHGQRSAGMHTAWLTTPSPRHHSIPGCNRMSIPSPCTRSALCTLAV